MRGFNSDIAFKSFRKPFCLCSTLSSRKKPRNFNIQRSIDNSQFSNAKPMKKLCHLCLKLSHGWLVSDRLTFQNWKIIDFLCFHCSGVASGCAPQWDVANEMTPAGRQVSLIHFHPANNRKSAFVNRLPSRTDSHPLVRQNNELTRETN